MSEWKSTNYHGHVQSDDSIKLENGKWYEIGFQLQFPSDKNFGHQGILMYNDGFFDENGYHLKPFPTHAREIVLTEPVI
jgi:hypothetical protein